MTTTGKRKEEKDYLLLKWGSLKAWDFSHNPVAAKLLKKWAKLGSSMSAIAHHDTLEQKQLICQMIDAVDCKKITSDWDGKEMTKRQAKKYVMEYGTK